jgi:hypothetical protein
MLLVLHRIFQLLDLSPYRGQLLARIRPAPLILTTLALKTSLAVLSSISCRLPLLNPHVQLPMSRRKTRRFAPEPRNHHCAVIHQRAQLSNLALGRLA